MNGNKNLKQHMMSDKAKWIVSAIAFLLLGVFVAAACTQGFTNGNPWGWFDKKEETSAGYFPGGMELSGGSGTDKIALTSAVIAKADYADYGVSAVAEDAVTVTAQLLDADGVELPEEVADEIEISWSVEWAAGDGWAAGKTASNYVTVQTGSDSHSVTVSCTEAFGTQMQLWARVTDPEPVSASLDIDYRQRLDHLEWDIQFGESSSAAKYHYSSKDVLGGVVVSTLPLSDSVTWDSYAKCAVKAVGTEVYTKEMEAVIGACTVETPYGYSEKIRSVGGTAVADATPYRMIAGGSGEFLYKVSEMFGLTGYSSLTLSAFKRALYVNMGVQYNFTYGIESLTVNGAEIELENTSYSSPYGKLKCSLMMQGNAFQPVLASIGFGGSGDLAF